MRVYLIGPGDRDWYSVVKERLVRSRRSALVPFALLSYRVKRTADGKWGIESLTISPIYASMREFTAPLVDGGITSDLLRRIRIGAQLRYARAAIKQQTRDPQAVRPTRKGRRVGAPRKKPAAFYLRVSKRFGALTAAMAPHPAKTLAEEFGYSRQAMRKLLQRLRDKGDIPRL